MENLKILRIKANLKQSELAEKVGVKQRDISKFENNLSEPKLSTAAKIAKVLKCNIEDIL